MDLSVLVYLSSGIFLGWSLGANDAANVFGTAVGSRMIKFATAALICSIFVTLGAVISGAGAAHTLSKLGAINALPGSFMAAFAAAITVAGMTVLGLPVSTTQGIVGAIIGWNLYTHSITDFTVFYKIVSTWVLSPLLTAVFSYFTYKLVMKVLNSAKIHLLSLDAGTRLALIIAGILGSYSLGANNIANVMGVFISANPFTDFSVAGLFSVTGLQQLFFIGGLAIAVGVYTYSKKVMMTVGDSLAPLTPVGAFVVVIATSVVLFLFASEDLEHLLAAMGLPTIPLVPVSSSQAVVGGVVGIGLIKNARNIRYSVLGRIVVAWINTPLISALICFVSLFIMENVFNQVVFEKVEYRLSAAVLDHYARKNVEVAPLADLANETFSTSGKLQDAIRHKVTLPYKIELEMVNNSQVEAIHVEAAKIPLVEAREFLSPARLEAVKKLVGQTFQYRWQVEEALAAQSEEWRLKEKTILNKPFNKEVGEKMEIVLDLLSGKLKA